MTTLTANRWSTVLVLCAGALLVALMVTAGCYTGTPACRPGTVDYPRCNDLTQPSWNMKARDGGADAVHRSSE